MHSVSTKLTTTCGKHKKSRKIICLITRNQIRDETSSTNLTYSIMLQLQIQRPYHLMPAPLCHRTNPSQENFYWHVILTEKRKDLNDFSSGSMKGNSITCLCISFVYCEDASQSNSYVSYWIRCKPLLIIKVSFIFPFEPRMYV